MTGQESRPGGRSQAASEVLAVDTFMVAADAHNFGRGMPVSERRALARRGMAALKDALPDLVEQLARRCVQQAIEESLPTCTSNASTTTRHCEARASPVSTCPTWLISAPTSRTETPWSVWRLASATSDSGTAETTPPHSSPPTLIAGSESATSTGMSTRSPKGPTMTDQTPDLAALEALAEAEATIEPAASAYPATEETD